MHDCLIIGGGVIGLSLAYELSSRGTSVALADRGEPGREASWAGAGILPPARRQSDVHPVDALRAISNELHPRWAEALREQTGIDTGYRRCGGIYLARSAGEAAALQALASLLQAEDVRTERLAPGALSELEPALEWLVKAGQVRTAYHLPDEAQLRNPWHLRALVAGCRQRGVEILAGTEVKQCVEKDRRLLRVSTTSGEIKAGKFCFTAGAWTGLLMQQRGLTLGIEPIRGQMVLYRCPRPLLRRIVNDGPRYLVPREDGRLLVGSTEEEAGFDKSNTPAAIAELRNWSQSLLPQLVDTPIEQAWAGLRPRSRDGCPYLGPVPGLDNAWIAAGHFRSGLHLSPATAVVMSQLVLGEPPPLDLSPFRTDRG